MSKSTMKIIGWVVSIVIAIIGTFGATTAITNKNNNNNSNKNDNKQTQNQTQEQKQEQNISITINGEQVEINKDNAQTVYGELEDEKNDLKVTVDDLNEKLDYYKQYGAEALVSTNPSYEEKTVSPLVFNPVKYNNWKVNEGTTKDSLDNEYKVSLPYVVMAGDSYGKYYTKGKFSKLKFKIAPHESMGMNNTATVTISINDGMTVKTIEDISRSFVPQTYTIDVKGAEFVTIECKNANTWWSDSASTVMLIDAQFIK